MAHKDTAALLRKHGYSEIKKVGEGSFGKAILVRKEGGEQLICKMVDVSRASRKEAEDAAKEAKVLSQLNHPYIVNYRESFTETGWFCILMDFCEAGDLTKAIDKAKRERKPLLEDQVMKWFTQTILALKYIHDKHILHRDLKPQNLFLSKQGSLKMGDFGISKVLDCTLAVARTQIGTPYYLSPELCQERPYTWPSDIWAMGCILYEMCALKVPFDAESIPKLVQKICSGNVPAVPATYPSFIRQLVSEMLSKNPDKRPDCENILQRPQIQEIVRTMMQEVKEKEEQANARVDVNAPSKVVETAGQNGSINYKVDDQVDFWSNSHKCWLPAIVINADADGRIVIDLKPNTWITKEQQAQSVRSRSSPNNGNVQPRVSASPNRGRSPSPASYTPKFQRSPSQGSFTPKYQRTPSQGSVGAQRPGSRERPSSRGPVMQRSPSGNVGQPLLAGAYRIGDLCEYWSTSHNDWLPATVINTDPSGQIAIDLKPNTWISIGEQKTKVRPRKNPPPSHHRPSSGNLASSPQFARPPVQRSPSWGAGNHDFRAPSPSYRAPSPSRRAMTPVGARGSSPSGRMGTPGRREMTPRRAGSREPSPHGIYPRPPISQSPLRQGGMAIAGL